MHAKASPVGTELLRTDDAQPVAAEDALTGQQREVEHVLVVDLVDLRSGQHCRELGELDAQYSFGCQHPGQSSREIVRLRRVGEDVVGDDEVGCHPTPGEPPGELGSEETDLGGNAGRERRRDDILGRVDAKHRDAELHEVTQQVAVVGGDFDDKAPIVEGATAPGSLRNRLAWLIQVSEYEEK